MQPTDGEGSKGANQLVGLYQSIPAMGQVWRGVMLSTCLHIWVQKQTNHRHGTCMHMDTIYSSWRRAIATGPKKKEKKEKRKDVVDEETHNRQGKAGVAAVRLPWPCRRGVWFLAKAPSQRCT